MRRLASHFRDGLLSLTHPLSCFGCGLGPIDGAFCEGCHAELVRRPKLVCPRCALTQGPSALVDEKGCSECRGKSLGFDEALAIGPYRHVLREACLSMKHRGGAWLARWLADMLLDVEGERLRAMGAQIIVPVPLHWQRRWERGFNQSEEVAMRLGGRLGLPVRRPLVRTQGGFTLSGLSRTERMSRMNRAFRAKPMARVGGQTVILVDDILTTGATCGSAARSLKQVGVSRVVAVVLARAEIA